MSIKEKFLTMYRLWKRSKKHKREFMNEDPYILKEGALRHLENDRKRQGGKPLPKDPMSSLEKYQYLKSLDRRRKKFKTRTF